MRVSFFSSKFHPAHVNMIKAMAESLNEYESNIIFTFNLCKGYFNFDPWFHEVEVASPKENVDDIDFTLYVSPSLKALLSLLVTRIFKKRKLIYVLHEPSRSISIHFKNSSSLFAFVKLLIVDGVNFLSCLFSHRVMVLSNKSEQKLKQSFLFSRSVFKSSLMFIDKHDFYARKYNYISYIGTIAIDHAFDDYLRFVKYCLSKNLLQDQIFLVASKSKLQKYHYDIIGDLINHPRLFLNVGRLLTDDEILSFYSSSSIVWGAYKYSSQSGVLPFCYMFGVPIICSDGASSSFYKDLQNGVVIQNYDPSSILSAVYQIKDSYKEMSACCRNSFLYYFDSKKGSGSKQFHKLISDLT